MKIRILGREEEGGKLFVWCALGGRAVRVPITAFSEAD